MIKSHWLLRQFGVKRKKGLEMEMCHWLHVKNQKELMLDAKNIWHLFIESIGR